LVKVIFLEAKKEDEDDNDDNDGDIVKKLFKRAKPFK
jgi:hypothetical protein